MCGWRLRWLPNLAGQLAGHAKSAEIADFFYSRHSYKLSALLISFIFSLFFFLFNHTHVHMIFSVGTS